MQIVHISSEMAPFIKVGGLGDALSGLCRQQARQGHQVTVVLPKYDLMSDTCSASGEMLSDFVFLRAGAEEYHCRIWKAHWNDVRVLCIEIHHPARFFERQTVYGCSDDAQRFLTFCAAASGLFRQWGIAPDLFHLHDWHTAPFALMREARKPAPAASTPCVLTVHNFEHQGFADIGTLALFDLPSSQIPPFAWEGSGANLLKASIAHVHQLVTVSPNYCREVQTPMGGRGLDEMLVNRAQSGEFEGILNGIDISYWTPKGNAFLPLEFDAQSLTYRQSSQSDSDQKREMKRKLARRFGLDSEAGPWVVCIARLVPQKGLDLIESALRQVAAAKGTFVLLGSSPVPQIQRRFELLGASFAKSAHARIFTRYEESLAHWLFAAADLIAIPSIFEPCGLTQMIGMRFGAIPLVRHTGGLADTVFDFDTSSYPTHQRNGFCFSDPTAADLEMALGRAMNYWRLNSRQWRSWVQRAMEADFSWALPAQRYDRVYRRSLGLPLPKSATSQRSKSLIAANS